MSKQPWTVSHHAVGQWELGGFSNAKSARQHSRKHFLDPRERWEQLTKQHPRTFRDRLKAGDEQEHLVLDDAAGAYLSTSRRYHNSQNILEAARVKVKPDGSKIWQPRLCFVSNAGILSFFVPAEDDQALSHMATAYRPCHRTWKGAPSTGDYIRAARNKLANVMARSKGRGAGRKKRKGRRARRKK